MTMSYLYDTANRLTEVRYPAQYGMAGSPRKTVNPSYDNASRLTQMNVNGQIQMSEIVYNPLSQVTQLKTGAATGNADIEQYSYDAQTGLLTNQKVIKQNTSQTLLDLSYNYSRLSSKGSLNGKTGQLTNIVNNLDRNKDRVYEFDTLGRLITAKGGVAAGGSGVANWTQSYAFDRYGNRQSVSASGVTANNQAVPTDGLASLSYQTTTNRINTSGYEYDLAGSQTRGQSPTGAWQRFEYDSAGRLVVVKADDNTTVLETYTYGASRQRLQTISGSLTTYYAWGGSSVLCEYTETTGNGATFAFKKSYIYAGSRLLSTQIWNGTAEITEFHHPDRLGTKLVTNNATGTHYEQSTLPFGTTLNAESSGFSNQVFTSYDRSAGTGLDYAVNRSYSSGQGRFTTVDPIGAGSSEIGSPQSLNLFAYVENNPIDFVDPSGLDGTFDIVYEPYLLPCDGRIKTEAVLVTVRDDPEEGGGIISATYYVTEYCDKDSKPKPIDGNPPNEGGGPPNKPESIPIIPIITRALACIVAAIALVAYLKCLLGSNPGLNCKRYWETYLQFYEMCRGGSGPPELPPGNPPLPPRPDPPTAPTPPQLPPGNPPPTPPQLPPGNPPPTPPQLPPGNPPPKTKPVPKPKPA
jgi:RHS repeat-associated protein